MNYLLIDGNNLASRCRHSQARLHTSQGRQSGTVSGFLLGLMYAMKGFIAQEVIVVWDGGRAKWRYDIYPEYKSGRKQSDDEDEIASYCEQLLDIREILKHKGIRQIQVSGVEADDIVGYLCSFLKPEDTFTIYTTDEDFYQLICPRISVLHPKHGIISGEHLKEKYGVDSGKGVLLYKAVVGDPGDAIKGVPGIGDASMRKVQKYLQIVEGHVTCQDVSQILDPSHRRIVNKITNKKDVTDRNVKLMDLSRGVLPEYIQSVQDQFYAKSEVDNVCLYSLLRKYELNEIGKRFVSV